MMKKIIRQVIALLSFFFATACVEPIILDPMEKMPVIVTCVLTNKNNQTLNLYYANRPSETEYVNITDARVQIIGGGKTYSFYWNGEAWSSQFTPEYGTTYDLFIELNSGEIITSSTLFPEKVTLKEKRVCMYNILPYISESRYCYLDGCTDDVYLWILGHDDKTSHFFTNHYGVDNINLVSGSIKDFEFYEQVSTHIPDEWKETNSFYLDLCSSLPCHYKYLRIHHPSDYNNGIAEDMIYFNGIRSPFPEGFIIATDYLIQPSMSGYLVPYSYMDIAVYITNKVYDEFLARQAKAGILKDELANLYSTNLDYTNIEGGLGIFGALYRAVVSLVSGE